MKDLIYTEDYAHKNGLTYRVEVYPDYDTNPFDYSDCHGVIERDLDLDPRDEGELQDYLDDRYGENGEHDHNDEMLEDEARLRNFRLLTHGHHRRDAVWYDVLGSMDKARNEWGTPPERVAEVVDSDYEYLKGWYDDSWTFVTVFVYRIDSDGEKDEDNYHACGGYESTIMDADQRKWFEEVIEDGIHDVEYQYRKQLHKDQLELRFD